MEGEPKPALNNSLPILGKVLISLASILITFFVIEVTFKHLATEKEEALAKKCNQQNAQQLNDSRVFSIVNSYYSPSSSVFHCGGEWEYTYNIDHNGFRKSQNINPEEPILAVGDSFTFGFGVRDEEAFPSLLSAHNAGIWSGDFEVQFNALVRGVELVEPKTVIWSFYPAHIVTMMPNDWSSQCPGEFVYFEGSSVSAKFGRYITKDFFLPLSENSYFVKYILDRLHIKEIKLEENKVEVIPNCYRTKELILYDKNLENNRYTHDQATNESLKTDRDEVYAEIQGYFEKAKFILDEKDIEIYFVIIPSRMSLMISEGSYKSSYKESDLDPSLPASTFTEIIRNAGFSDTQILDLRETFYESEFADWRDYYFVVDAHWNSKGHEFVAETIKKWMKL